MINGTSLRRARQAQVSGEFARFGQELEAWFSRWKSVGLEAFRVKHGRQMERLKTTLLEAVAGLEGPLRNLSLQLPVSSLYKECQAYELRLIWLRRIWSYYRGKFEQRLEPDSQRLLAAADEVVWACYAPAFRSLAREVPPPPLPYIEPQFTARAIPMDEPPPELKSDVDDEFREQILALLPVAVISLPPACATAPWWLAVVAHEVGHHLQHELGLVKAFEAILAKEDDAKWLLWNEEIFADLISVLCVGPAAPRALAEVELSSDSIATSYGSYPATIVRLELMRQSLCHLKASPEKALGEAMDELLKTIRADLPTTTAGELKAAERVAAGALDEPWCEGDTLKSMAPWEPAGFMDGGDWGSRLRNGDKLTAPATPSSVRRLVAAAVAAWDEILELPDDKTAIVEEGNLRKSVTESLLALAEPGDRLGGPQPMEDQGHRLAQLLLSRSSDALRS